MHKAVRQDSMPWPTDACYHRQSLQKLRPLLRHLSALRCNMIMLSTALGLAGRLQCFRCIEDWRCPAGYAKCCNALFTGPVRQRAAQRPHCAYVLGSLRFPWLQSSMPSNVATFDSPQIHPAAHVPESCCLLSESE